MLTVGLVYLLPVVYEPLFNRFTPVEGEVRDRVLAIAQRAGVRVDDVLVADASRRTTRQNAYVSGLGATKRVVLYDTLLAKSTPEEVDLVVAHELAHVAHRDVLKSTVIGSAGAALLVLLIWRLVSWEALRGLARRERARRPAVAAVPRVRARGDVVPVTLPLAELVFAEASRPQPIARRSRTPAIPIPPSRSR